MNIDIERINRDREIRRVFLANLKVTEGEHAYKLFCDAACRRCAVNQGFNAEWRCLANNDPVECDCTALAEIIAERMS